MSIEDSKGHGEDLIDVEGFPLDAVIDVEDGLFDGRPLGPMQQAARDELDMFRAHMETKVAAWELWNEVPHPNVWHEGMTSSNETRDKLLQQIARDWQGGPES